MDKIKSYKEYLWALTLLVAGILLGKLPNNIGWYWTIAILVFVPLIVILIMNIVSKPALDLRVSITKKLMKWWKTPNIAPRFILPTENDLRLRLHNPSHSKHVYISCENKAFLTRRGKWYIHEFPNELHPVSDLAPIK